MRLLAKKITPMLLSAAMMLLLGDAVASAEAISVSSLSGYAYVEVNNFGHRDPEEEWLLPEVEVVLSRVGDSSPLATAMTNDVGFYEFTNLAEGAYQLSLTEIPLCYTTVAPSVGRLITLGSETTVVAPPTPGAGTVVPYNQQLGILPGITGIQLPDAATSGFDYNFGVLWIGKAWYLSGGQDMGDPPRAVPPLSVIPEPSGLPLLIAAAALLRGRRRGRR